MLGSWHLKVELFISRIAEYGRGKPYPRFNQSNLLSAQVVDALPVLRERVSVSPEDGI